MSGSDCTKPKACRFPGQHPFGKLKRLCDFIVEGVKRYWLHIALGRDLVSGNVDELGTQLEEVTE
jgi:hypothetical protein